MIETTVHGYEPPVFADERNGRAGSSRWLTNNRSMSPVECQAGT